MKKILLIFILLVSGLSYSQKGEFVDYFTHTQIVEDSGIESGWTRKGTKITFNRGGYADKILLESGTLYLELTQVGYTFQGTTYGGHKFQAMTLTDVYGTECMLQYFDDQIFGVRLILFDGITIEMNK